MTPHSKGRYVRHGRARAGSFAAARAVSNAAIAKALDISIQTVDVHLRSVRKKLKVDDTAVALLEAYKRGLIEY